MAGMKMRQTDFSADFSANLCTDFSTWLTQQAQRVEAALHAWLPAADGESAETTQPATLHTAMRYAVLGGGKRVRAALVYAAGDICLNHGATDTGLASDNGAGQLPPMSPSPFSPLQFSQQQAALDRCAAAVELMHAYSLIHDDLPCMDDDDMRRGRASVHRHFDEATALLAGDALQPLAFELLAQMPIAPARVVQSVALLARAVGSGGMVGGQAIDCASVGQRLTQEQLQTMHAMKTGALLQASVLLGALVSGGVAGAGLQQPPHQYGAQGKALETYAHATGLAFQVADDILDAVGSSATLGKTAGKDAARDKPTYVSLLGLDAAQQLLADLTQAAHEALRPLGQAALRLGQLADFIAQRRY